MSTTVTIVIICVCVFDLFIAGLIIWSLVGKWNGIADKHPAAEPSPDAIRKDFQSFKLGLFNLGYSVHVAVDAEHLHLFPAKIIRAFGARPMSIAWDAVRLKRAGKRSAVLQLGFNEMQCPAWCVEPIREGEST